MTSRTERVRRSTGRTSVDSEYNLHLSVCACVRAAGRRRSWTFLGRRSASVAYRVRKAQDTMTDLLLRQSTTVLLSLDLNIIIKFCYHCCVVHLFPPPHPRPALRPSHRCDKDTKEIFYFLSLMNCSEPLMQIAHVT